MRRRDFLIVMAAAGAIGGAPAPVDPLEALPRPLRKRLAAFAKVVERQAWTEAVGFFDAEHHADQHKLYFSPEVNEDPPDPNDPSAQQTFTGWYLLDTMGLRTSESTVDEIDEVTAIRFKSWEEPQGTDGPLRILLEVDTKAGPRIGAFLVDRETSAFYAAVG